MKAGIADLDLRGVAVQPTDLEFGERLKAARERCGLSQADIADQLHVSRPAYGQWETGRVVPGLDRIRHLSLVLGLAPENLAFGTATAQAGDLCWLPILGRPGDQSASWPMLKSYLEETGLSPDKARIWKLHETWPNFGWRAGDLLLVRTGEPLSAAPGIYLLRQGDQLVPAHLAREPTRTQNGVIVVSMGDVSWRVAEADLDLVGQLIRCWSNV